MTYRITLLLCLIVSISIQAQTISENHIAELAFSSERPSQLDFFQQS
ncbi:hypothetical protein OKW21_005759 [Catalinimonas alkaloidigena]|nr:hypothetical protein [Catalinimonas alkaloidigena]